MPINHDKQVSIFAAERLVIGRNGGNLVLDAFPDEVERQERAVDLLAHDGIGTIVVEHTVVESYLHQVHDNVRITEVFNGFERRFEHSLAAPGFYTLAVHTSGGHLFPRREAEAAALDEMEHWIRSQLLPDPSTWPPPQGWITAGPPAVPVAVTLYRARCGPEDDGALRVALQAPGSLKEQRRDRAATAFAAKCPKLEVARTADATTLLALEMRDFVMSNPVVLAQAIHAAAHGRSDLPDVIICVDTCAGDGHWMPYVVKNGGWWSDAARDLPRLSVPIRLPPGLHASGSPMGSDEGSPE